jgi:hypothetical protein
MRDKTDVSPFRDQLIFGRTFAEQAMVELVKAAVCTGGFETHPYLPDRDTGKAAMGLRCQTA